MTAEALHVAGCCLNWVEAEWPYATQHQAAIERHWREQSAGNANFFNGRVHLLSSWRIDDDNIFHGQFFRTDFKSYLLWRYRDYEESGAMDGFGSALILSEDKQILMGEQATGNVNTGLLDCIGGFIDERDCLGDGQIDIDASISREIREETGFAAEGLERQPGYWIAMANKQISIAIVFQARQKAADLVQRVTSFLATEAKPELQSVRSVSASSLPAGVRIPDYARCLIDAVSD
jgi:NUDIX domain